jgi:hypothetical protein
MGMARQRTCLFQIKIRFLVGQPQRVLVDGGQNQWGEWNKVHFLLWATQHSATVSLTKNMFVAS